MNLDLQATYWIVGAIVAALTAFNFIKAWGREGTRDFKEHEKEWNVRFDMLDAKIVHHEIRTNERIERMLERLNEALLTMAREHPTKSDLQMVKEEILDRIDRVQKRG